MTVHDARAQPPHYTPMVVETAERLLAKQHVASYGLLDLIGQFSIMSSLLEQVDFWDLVQLSRTCSFARGICHGFERVQLGLGEEYISNTNIRAALQIGYHNTSTWKLYKSLTQVRCREPDHTRGKNPSGCKLCSKPVCLACIVKHSIGKQENTFQCRGRNLCRGCFKKGNPHSRRIVVQGDNRVRINYSKLGLCQCTSNDGILCLDCKGQQNKDSLDRYKTRCAGIDCDQELHADMGSAKVCLWCESMMPAGSSRQFYDTGLVGLWKVDEEFGGESVPESNKMAREQRKRRRWMEPPSEASLPGADALDRPAVDAVVPYTEIPRFENPEVPPYTPRSIVDSNHMSLNAPITTSS